MPKRMPKINGPLPSPCGGKLAQAILFPNQLRRQNAKYMGVAVIDVTWSILARRRERRNGGEILCLLLAELACFLAD